MTTLLLPAAPATAMLFPAPETIECFETLCHERGMCPTLEARRLYAIRLRYDWLRVFPGQKPPVLSIGGRHYEALFAMESALGERPGKTLQTAILLAETAFIQAAA